jgi:hypothetical protein
MNLEQLYKLYKDLSDLVRRHKHSGIESEKMNQGVRDVLMSFETGEQGVAYLYFPFAVRITKLRGTVVKALANTDTGTVQGANSTGSSSGGLLTGAISAALGTEYVTTAITTNYMVGKDSYYKLTSAKTTAGGKMLVTIEWERL